MAYCDQVDISCYLLVIYNGSKAVNGAWAGGGLLIWASGAGGESLIWAGDRLLIWAGDGVSGLHKSVWSSDGVERKWAGGKVS